MRHVDEFIDRGINRKCEDEKYARWMLNHFRLPARLSFDFDRFMELHKLFCDFDGERYRVTGASSLGDVWLTKDFNQRTGYQKRVDVDEISNWGKEP